MNVLAAGRPDYWFDNLKIINKWHFYKFWFTTIIVFIFKTSGYNVKCDGLCPRSNRSLFTTQCVFSILMYAKKVGIVSTFQLFPRGNLKNHTKEKLLPRTSSPKLFYMAKKFIFENVWCSTFIDELSTANILWWKKWIQFITTLENIKWRYVCTYYF